MELAAAVIGGGRDLKPVSPEGARTAAARGATTQPRPHRLDDGRILLTFTRVTSQVDYDVALAILDRDS